MATPMIVTTTTISHVSQSGRLRTASCSSLPFRIGTSGTGSYEGRSYQSSLTSQSPDPTDQRPVNDVPDDASAFRESSVPRCTMCPVHLPLEMGQSSHFVHTSMEVLCHRDSPVVRFWPQVPSLCQ